MLHLRLERKGTPSMPYVSVHKPIVGYSANAGIPTLHAWKWFNLEECYMSHCQQKILPRSLAKPRDLAPLYPKCPRCFL